MSGGWFGWAASAIRPAVDTIEKDGALVAGSLEPLLPSDVECQGVVESDIKDLTHHIINDVETYANNHLPSPPFMNQADSNNADADAALPSLPPVNHKTSSSGGQGQLLPVDSDELKQILRSMSKRDDTTNDTASSSSSTSSTTSASASGWQFHHLGHVNEKDAKRITITSSQLNELSKQYEQATGKKSEFYEQLKQQISNNTSDNSSNNASPSSSTASSSDARADSKNNVVVRTDKDNGDQVAVVDLSQLDWWTFVSDKDTDKKSATESDSGSDSEEKKSHSPVPRETEDGWQLIDNDDFVHALSDFIAETMKNNPDIASKIPPEQLKKMLTDVFIQVKHPGTASKLWQWGTFAYHAYSWGTTIMQLYNNKLVVQGLYTAATWVLVLLF